MLPHCGSLPPKRRFGGEHPRAAVDDKLMLEFNLAYSPSCTYDSRWICPLGRPANRLPVEIRAASGSNLARGSRAAYDRPGSVGKR